MWKISESFHRSASRSGVSHPHISTTLQPKSSSWAFLFLSRFWFSANFSSQNSLWVSGMLARLQVWRCQKHPCTKITVLYLGKTRSGFPGRWAPCNRKRNPSLWAHERTINSGTVCFPLTELIIRLRTSGATLSIECERLPSLYSKARNRAQVIFQTHAISSLIPYKLTCSQISAGSGKAFKQALKYLNL